MSARSRRRRERAAQVVGTAAPPTRRPPLALPAVVAGAGAVLLALAWTTTLAPGPGRTRAEPTRFAIDIPPGRQAAINSWERFFVCYDLTDPAIVSLTLRANQRARGSLDFPGTRIEVELPSPDAAAPAPSSDEDALIAARQSVLAAAVPARAAALRGQCGTGR